MYEILFLDLDDTIFDFHKAEADALSSTLREFGVEPTDEIRALYHRINLDHWKRLERRELTRDQVRMGRFEVLFSALGVAAEPEACALTYERYLSSGHYYLPGAEETLKYLQGKYRLFLASNGTAAVQRGRMNSANLEQYFEDVFISEEVGYDKPDLRYYETAFARIPGFDRAKTLMVGDSLTSDIRGANNAGIAACWVNPSGAPRPADLRVDYELETFAQLPALLKIRNNS